MKKITVCGHAKCIEMVSGRFRLAVTTQVGPRVIHGSIAGSENIFRVLPPVPFSGCDTGFTLYGGHRLWHSPEALPRSYAADNDPVEVVEAGNGIEFRNAPEVLTGLQKAIHIEPLGDERFNVTHRLTNCGVWPIEVAPWALSVMAQGGMAVIPQQRRPKDGDPFVPDRSLVLWCYSSLADPRLVPGERYILLRQDPKATGPCKIGFNAELGWVAYVNAGTALVKRFTHFVDAEYPDGGCSVESYTCADFCEIETVAPLYSLEPGETAEHVELWEGLAGLPRIRTEADVSKHLEPRLA
jgi:hypothetical protein